VKRLYVVHFGPAEEPEFFADTGDGQGLKQAIEAAQTAIREMFDPSTGIWGEFVDKVYVAEIFAMVVETDRIERPPPEELDIAGVDREGIDWSGGHDYIVDYGLAMLSERSDPASDNSKTVH